MQTNRTRLFLRLLTLPCALALLAWAWQTTPPVLTRGPYLQAATSSSIVLVCRTNVASALTLRWGEHAGDWDGETSSPAGTTHVFALDGLRAETRFHYELAAGATILAGGAEHVFRTSPPRESRAPFRFLAWGDSGNGSPGQRQVAEWMLRVVPEPVLALGLGDLVYEEGEWENYDPHLFAPYRALFRRTTFWPTMGNHDIDTENGAPYLDAFHLPTDTGAPGQPSGTELYYSFDHGQAHFTCLDSESTITDPGSPMYLWAEADLAAARARGARWLFVFMHHPPYSRGSHDSTMEQELIDLRADLVPLFEAQDVDMVLVGHSHSYERSFLAQGDAILQPDVSEYSKIGSPDGTIYLVSGCGGKSDTGPLDHPLMARSRGDILGFSVIDVSWEEVRGRFIESDGRTTDLFTLRKDLDTRAPRVAASLAEGDTALKLVFDEPVRPGTAADGAENLANYAMDQGVAVLGATLDTDQSTVALVTSPLDENRAYALDVTGVADPAGNAAAQRVRFARAPDRLDPMDLVPQGALWRHLGGASAPPAGWNELGFDDSTWSAGPAGFGYEDGDDATILADMQDAYVSLFVRTTFQVPDPALVKALQLRVSYDDGFVAYLNGVEIARGNVTPGQDHLSPARGSHEAGTFEPFDVTAFGTLLVAGENVLALQGHNSDIGSNDFSLHPELSVRLADADDPPVARIDAPVRTANAPANLRFSAARSEPGAAPLAEYEWDFGDGLAPETGVEVTHVFGLAGTYTVTLLVRDGAGVESLADVQVRIHAQGLPPELIHGADDVIVPPGTQVAFDASLSHDPDGGAVTFHWDFDDPASGALDRSTLAAPVHVFADLGTYDVQLVVTDDEGSGRVAVQTITVTDAVEPAAAFSAQASASDPLRILFTDLSTGDVTSWQWDFGDGGASTEQSPEHLYAAPGNYTVVLTATGPAGVDVFDDVVTVTAGGGGGGGGGGCWVAPGADWRSGDPLLAALVGLVLLALLARSRSTRRVARSQRT
jgi:PKD repeat protein